MYESALRRRVERKTGKLAAGVLLQEVMKRAAPAHELPAVELLRERPLSVARYLSLSFHIYVCMLLALSLSLASLPQRESCVRYGLPAAVLPHVHVHSVARYLSLRDIHSRYT